MLNPGYIMTPAEYKAVDEKLFRIQSWIGGIAWAVILEAYKDINRCRSEVKYEYLSSKDSWL